MKDTYKELKKKLKNKFEKPVGNNYAINLSVGEWCIQCGVKPTSKTIKIIGLIFGSIPYPYQEADRLKILTYLEYHKYKDFKKEFDL